MPRKNPSGTFQDERNIAHYIEDERRLRGLSQEGLAKLVTDAGCPLQGSAIFRIESPDKPRTISFNEAVAFAKVFNTSLEALSTPRELRNQERARDIALALAEASRQLDDAHAAVLRAVLELVSIAKDSPELYEFVTHQFLTADKDRKQWFAEFGDDQIAPAALSHLAVQADRFWNDLVQMMHEELNAETD